MFKFDCHKKRCWCAFRRQNGWQMSVRMMVMNGDNVAVMQVVHWTAHSRVGSVACNWNANFRGCTKRTHYKRANKRMTKVVKLVVVTWNAEKMIRLVDGHVMGKEWLNWCIRHRCSSTRDKRKLKLFCTTFCLGLSCLPVFSRWSALVNWEKESKR